MSKANILVQFDTDEQPSLFDSVVAIDSSVDHLFQYGGIHTKNVEALVHGAMFTRGAKDLSHTAIYVGGSNVKDGEDVLKKIQDCFFGPMRVSVMLDSNGSNTTAAAAVIAAARHLDLANSQFTVLAASGPVGRRVALLLAHSGAEVNIVSRSSDRAAEVAASLTTQVPEAEVASFSNDQITDSLAGSHGVISAGAAGVELITEQVWKEATSLKVAVDLNAVPPLGIQGIDIGDKAVDHHGVTCYGAIGVGGTKMKIHKESIRRLFQQNDLVLDALSIFAVGEDLEEEGKA